MATSKVLLHACCAPCMTSPLEMLLEEGREVEALWYAPNVQPYQEHLRRKHEVQRYSALHPIVVHYIEEYPLAEWLVGAMEAMDSARGAGADPDAARCRRCHCDRLDRAAGFASKNGFDAFTSTLLVSRHQDHEAVRAAGEEAGRRNGVDFLYRDFRKGWKRSIELSRRDDLYRQPYCGCIFSEYERFGPIG
ncbi:MAG: epoxyqueuosine reductase QueH [Thermoplasmata archaeon]|nr:epoxyqueuosine reductase QueH [Thermoplasmata archaeon]